VNALNTTNPTLVTVFARTLFNEVPFGERIQYQSVLYMGIMDEIEVGCMDKICRRKL